jgi:hypothetical protein
MSDATLRLKAEAKEDLAVIAAAVQDAAFVLSDIVYDAKGRRFAAALNRFRWEAARRRAPYERVRSLLAVESVLAVKSRKVRMEAPDAAGVVLDLRFDPAVEEPAGALVLVLGGGGEIRLDVECIDVTLTDVGAPWPTPRRPDHERY